MNKYYRIVSDDGEYSACHAIDNSMKDLEVPWSLWGKNHLSRYYPRENFEKCMSRYYYWFTEEWYNSYILKCIKENQNYNTTVAILTTNTEPAFLDGQQACFKYCGSEKISNIELTTINCYLILEVHKI